MEIIYIYIVSGLQIVLALGLFNVWLVRFNKPTIYRGKGAKNMEAEFKAYGLPTWFMYLVGTVKLLIAGLLIVGLWFPFLVYNTTLVLCGLMLGAIAMHIKVSDSLVRTLPAISMFLMALIVVILIRMI